MVVTFFFDFCINLWTFAQNSSSSWCVLNAHHVFLFVSRLNWSVEFLVLFSKDWQNLILPKYLIFFAFNNFKYSVVSLFDEIHKEKELKRLYEKLLKKNHFLKVFFVILPLNKIKGNFFFFISKIKFGQISESTNKTISGLQFFRKLFINNMKSYGKNWWKTLLLSLNFFLYSLYELRVVVVIKNLNFSSFSK